MTSTGAESGMLSLPRISTTHWHTEGLLRSFVRWLACLGYRLLKRFPICFFHEWPPELIDDLGCTGV